jgi:glucose-fructose oxidoreductase
VSTNQIRKKIRYAVVGLGHLVQKAVLPAFKNARNCELAAIVSGDKTKLKQLSKLYGVERACTYDEYDKCLRSGAIDAVFIGLPNHLHCEYSVRAANAGVHVLCEKPMAIDEDECRRMIAASRKSRTKLMIAYRLHFEEGTLDAIELAASGKLGELRYFTAAFSQQVKAGNVRVTEPVDRGGGSMYDMGVYCINAARYLFRDEPVEVTGAMANGGDPRFRQTGEEMTTAILRFPGERIAAITSSFGAAPFSEYALVGTHGWVRFSPAYEYAEPLCSEVKIANRDPVRRQYPLVDQFGAELVYFSGCILKNREPEPDGYEGLADVRIVRAIVESARSGEPVKLGHFQKDSRPSRKQLIRKPAIPMGKPLKATSPTR